MGLDISSASLKVLKINTNVTPHVVENFAIAPVPAGAIVKEEIKNPVALSATLEKMLETSGIKSQSVALAIPRSLAIIKNLAIDARMNAEEIESRAWIEANRNFPDLIGEVYLDFMITGNVLPDENQKELVLVACRKEQIKPYLEILQNASLTPKIVDVNCYALERALSISEPQVANETIALLNLNTTLSSFIVVQNGNLIHAHDQSYDGQRLLNQVKTYLNSKDLNLQSNLVDDADYNNILKENLISHLRHTMHFFYSSKSNVAIQKILLSGECAHIPNLNTFIAKENNVETGVANAFKNMQLVPGINPDEFYSHAAELMLCCGLALSTMEHD